MDLLMKEEYDESISQLYPEIDQTELTKLIIQTLNDLGYHESSTFLQNESKLSIESEDITNFNTLIKNGEFEESIKLIDSLIFKNDELLSIDEIKLKIKFLIKREKFLEELFFKNNENLALIILRNEINELTNIQTIRSLTSLLMNKDSTSLQLKNGWFNNFKNSRLNLLNEIYKFINPNSMIPKFRLFNLLKQSIEYQKYLNLYQFGNLNEKISLFEDLKSNKTNFPNSNLKILNDHKDEVWFVLFSNDGSKLITCSADSFINIYDVNNDFKLIKKLKGHNKQVMFASFSPNDKYLLTCSIESKSRLWNLETFELEKIFELNNDLRIWCCDWFKNNEFIILGSPDKEINIFNINNGEKIQTLIGSRIIDLKLNKENNKLIVATYDKNIEIFDINPKNYSLTKFKILNINKKITNISISNKNTNQILINLSPNELQLWDFQKNLLLTKFIGHKQENFIIRSCFGYDENLICSGSEDGRIFLWNKEFGSLLDVLNGHLGICNCVAWNNVKVSMFASCGDDSAVKIWGPAKKN